MTMSTPEPTELVLSEDLKSMVNGAMMNGTTMVVAYVAPDGQPHLSMRGSVQAFDDQRLAIWVRNPEGGLLAAIPGNPRVALFYRDNTTRATFQFRGRAVADGSDAVRAKVYDNTPELERNQDPDRKGVAVIVDLDAIEGGSAAMGRVVMHRSTGAG